MCRMHSACSQFLLHLSYWKQPTLDRNSFKPVLTNGIEQLSRNTSWQDSFWPKVISNYWWNSHVCPKSNERQSRIETILQSQISQESPRSNNLIILWWNNLITIDDTLSTVALNLSDMRKVLIKLIKIFYDTL